MTHDRLEALSLGDNLLVLDEGQLVQRGPVQEIFNRPANLTVAGIVAVETVQPGRVVELQNGLATVQVGRARLTAVAGELPAGLTGVFVCIRAEDVILSDNREFNSSARNCLKGIVRGIASEGPLTKVELDCGFPLTALLTKQACAEMALKEGAPVLALVKATDPFGATVRAIAENPCFPRAGRFRGAGVLPPAAVTVVRFFPGRERFLEVQ